MFERLLETPPYSLRQSAKQDLLLPGLNELTRFHYERCPPYARIIDAAWGGLKSYGAMADLPFLPVQLFKLQELSSTTSPAITLQSSGTTGQTPSRIIVDAETADRQARALIATFRPILGDSRLPFLAIDTKDVLKADNLTARGAGVLGMMKFGAKATFALTPDLEIDAAAVHRFVAANGGRPFLIFGFTFLVWTKLFEQFGDGELDLSNAILVHSGGWKKLEEKRVSNAAFRAALEARFNLSRIYNFYGFVEQIGSMFVEGPDGLLYPPNFTDVIVRRPGSWEEAPDGEEGVLQVVSLLPRSYPGHCVLTEDRGTVVAVDGGRGNRFGKAISIAGRVAKAELRGCSDIIATEAR
ncbi:acyl-protein synthetase [Azorhizobium oxalatiphilum]|uniref:Acyl-protein synthetase n=1 Tax=Azorhizobium oxalatiphilum TaxID=980631 RepID=A0A917C2C4_9HYPH|nr:acyl-protein synthetase [Azorhizobium oxalatiphilum]GGF68596.1 acyl-protein synthetase [Azorhizobium oxalatiphilum]